MDQIITNFFNHVRKIAPDHPLLGYADYSHIIMIGYFRQVLIPQINQAGGGGLDGFLSREFSSINTASIGTSTISEGDRDKLRRYLMLFMETYG